MLGINCKDKVPLWCFCFRKLALKETAWVFLTKKLAAISPPGQLPALKEERKKREAARDNKG